PPGTGLSALSQLSRRESDWSTFGLLPPEVLHTVWAWTAHPVEIGLGNARAVRRPASERRSDPLAVRSGWRRSRGLPRPCPPRDRRRSTPARPRPDRDRQDGRGTGGVARIRPPHQ